MTEYLSTTDLYRSDVVAIRDVRCRARCGHADDEEVSLVDSVAFPRAGVFVKHLSRNQLVADPNQVVFFRRHEAYRVSHPVCGGDDCTVFHFAPEVLRQAVRPVAPHAADSGGSLLPYSHGPSGRRAILAVQALRKHLQSPNPDGIQVEELALAILADSLASAARAGNGGRRPARPDTMRAHRELAAATTTLLADRFRSRLTLGQIARSVHSSPFHLARVFRRLVGMPIHRYRNALRLRAALERLMQGETDLTRLALALGYASHSHFTDAFRVEFGFAPSEFRRPQDAGRLREMSKIPEV